MRLIATLNDSNKAQRLSAYLKEQGIDNQLESNAETDWGNDNYGTVDSHIWIIDEDHIEKAHELIRNFKDSDYPHLPTGPVQPKSSVEEGPKEEIQKQPTFPPPIQQPMGYATFYMLIACVMLYFMSQWTAEPLQPPYPKVPLTPLVSSPTKKALMYDYPHTYEIVDELAKLYGVNALRTPENLPTSGQKLYIKLFETPHWDGVYPAIVAHLQHKPYEQYLNVPMFEKLKEGEFWRPVTPIFLHNDIFHLLFNMLWLVVLGRQMEQRIGTKKLIIFVLLAGVFSNTAQYLMSGPNFIGFSGVLCAMLAYIWQRQKWAPWEGYQVQNQTLMFIFIFILGMASLQFLSFLSEVSLGTSFAPGIANTAHLSGALFGYLLSKLNIIRAD